MKIKSVLFYFLEWSLDRAETDAIESGAEEVEHLEQSEDEEAEKPVFQFVCGPFELVK